MKPLERNGIASGSASAQEREQSAPRLLEELVHQAEKAGASDIHLQMNGPEAQILFRLDGVMTPAAKLEAGVAERVFGRIKYLARLKTYQELLPQEGRIEKTEMSSRSDIRVATYPTVTGEKIVLRLFVAEGVKRLDDLQFPPEAIAELKHFLKQTSGMLLLTGPAGSGKTTAIYACLRHLVEMGGRHTITIEDPVEQIIPGIMQTEINEARGLNFATAARHLLRQDPQVLVIGEIRDDETANLAVRAALTGHLVISTLHAGSCKGVLERLFVMCPDHYAIISSLELILNQRLMRSICKACDGKGCETCLQSGYRGRIPVMEWYRVDDQRRADLKKMGPETVKPFRTIKDFAGELCHKKVTNEAECERLLGGGLPNDKAGVSL